MDNDQLTMINKRMKNRILLLGAFAVMIVQLIPNIVVACPRCFGAGVDTPVTQGISFAMLSLILITGGVLSGIVLFFLKMRKHAKQYELSKLAVSEQGRLVNMENQEIVLESDDIDSEVDKLLDKINQTGYDSLTTQEKALLENASKIKTGF